MTESKCIEIARKQYASVVKLGSLDNFYDYEKGFEAIMVNMSQQMLEKSLGTLPNDKRKKSIQTRFGSITMSSSHRHIPQKYL